MRSGGWKPFWAALFASLLVLVPLVGGTVLLSRQQLRTQLRQAARSESGVPIQLPKTTDQLTVLLCVSGEQPGFVLAYLNASQNCVHLLGVPAVLTVPFADEQAALAQCYAAAGPARCREALMQVLAAAMPRMKMDMAEQMKEAQQLYLKYGITTVQEGAAMAQTMQGLTAFAASGGLELDVVAYILKEDYEKTVKEYADYNGKYKNRVKIGGVKVILDGSPQGKSAWLSKPYEGEENYCGYPTHNDAYVTKAAKDAVRGGYQILAHCNGDAASEQFIQSYQAALKETGTADGDYRPVMIHCQTVRDDQLDRMAQLKMIPSIFIGHTYYWGDIHLKNLGAVRGARISPVKSALERGLIYNFHQDTPVTKPDMLHSVWCAVNRVTRKGQPIGQEQCINVYEALQAVTINAAYAYKEEDQKGTLEAGKMADMVILDANPLKADKKCIKDIVVLETIKEGKTVYKN